MNSLWEAVDAVGGWFEGSLDLVARRVHLEAGGTGTPPYPASLRELLDLLAKPVTYAIDVYTADVKNAGTDANVFITLHGGWGIDLAERELDKPGNDFERDSKSHFTLSGPLIGGVNSVRIRHNNKGNAPGWYLDQISVRRIGSLLSFFNCNRWLARDEADCAIDLVLGAFSEPIPTPGVPIKCAAKSAPAEPAPEVQPFVGTVLVFNCSTQHRPIHVWRNDLTAASGWKEEGSLDAQYNDSGTCPVGQPLSLALETDHVYLISAVDPDLIGCSGNEPGNPTCVRHQMWVKGKSGGTVVPWIVP